MSHQIKQRWTIKKIFCYIVYRLIAKHLPDKGDLWFIGKWGRHLRTLVCRPLLRESARVIGIGQGVDFGNGCAIIMKEYSHIGDYALIDGDHATLTIGRHVIMGKYCIILTQNHRYLEEGYDGFQGKDVVIDDYAWIGHRVTILPGIRIGKHTIIGAGAVVSKDVPDYGIAVGNPAVVKRYRKYSKNHLGESG